MSDPADLDRVRQAITHQEGVLGQHSRTLREITDGLRWLTTNVSALRTQLSTSAQTSASVSVPAPASAPASVPAAVPAASASLLDREPWVPAPERYDGNLGQCRSFLLQCGLVFDQQPRTYPTDRARIAYVIGLLRGEALEWASAAWEKQSQSTATYDAFTAEMRKLFDHPVRGKDASKRLCSLRQGGRSVAEYAIEFRTLAVESGWNEESLQAIFQKGLSEGLKDELLSFPETSSLDNLVSLAIRIENRCRERRRERRQAGSSDTPRPPAARFPRAVRPTPQYSASLSQDGGRGENNQEAEPMQLGRYRLDDEERQRRRAHNCCLYCGQTGHYIAACTQRPSNR